MAAKTYTVYNGAVPGAAAFTPISTGTALKTMLQLKTSTATAIRVVEWWTEFDGSAAAQPIKVELIGHTTAPQTTLTTYAAADIAPANDPNAAASDLSLGSNASGFGTGATEVTPTGTVRNLQSHYVPPTSGVYIQFPLGREPEIAANGAFLRHRTTAAAAVNCVACVVFEA